MSENRVLFIGASGSGTTTLGKAYAQKLGIPHIDLDNLFWKPTEIPFTEFRTQEELLTLANSKIYNHKSWVISGDPSKWGIGIEGRLTKVIFLECPTKVRVVRLNKRALDTLGDSVTVGGSNHETHQRFIEWTKYYDKGGLPGRSREKQLAWLDTLDCEIVKFRSDAPLDELIAKLA